VTADYRKYVSHEGANEGRVILHSDLNNFFASVECRRRPYLEGFPVAVCGSVKDRHGIVLAKNEMAKKSGIKTGQAIWQAKKLCPGLVVVQPDHNEYMYYSGLVRGIYAEYSDKVEPFGMDEAWIDLSADMKVNSLDDGKRIADEIRLRVRRETGLTVSVGVSDNKVFAKLASDFKKPDAVTVFGPDNYESTVAKIEVGELLFVGKNTNTRLHICGINTIGELAGSSEIFMKSMFGVNGLRMFGDASGFDTSGVSGYGEVGETKSVGNSVTLSHDLRSFDEVRAVFHSLSEKVAWRMRSGGFACTTVQISVRDTGLSTTERQCGTSPTSNALDIAELALRLFRENYDTSVSVRSIGVRGTNLVKANALQQIDMFDTTYEKKERLSRLDGTLDSLRSRYGIDTVKRAVCCVGRNNFRDGARLEII